MRSAAPSHSTGTGHGFGDRIAVEGHDGESVSGQGEAAALGGAAIEHVQQDLLAFSDA